MYSWQSCGGGVYCRVDFLLLLDIAHFIPELCLLLFLPPTLLPLLVFPNTTPSFSMLVSLSVAMVKLIAAATACKLSSHLGSSPSFLRPDHPLTEMRYHPNAFLFLKSA